MTSNNTNCFYNYINAKLGVSTSIPALNGANGPISDPKIMSNIFNNYFASVFVADNGQLPSYNPGHTILSSIKNIRITRKDIMDSLG